jgi:mRNA-degrading endonuclease RelE of RelBE toxin-antitoxin system
MKVIISKYFSRESKRLYKKHSSLALEVVKLIQSLPSDPFQGTPIGKDCYKIRLKIASKNTGKSGGARVITHVFVAGDTITLLSIYDKSEQDDIPETEILKRLKGLS